MRGAVDALNTPPATTARSMPDRTSAAAVPMAVRLPAQYRLIDCPRVEPAQVRDRVARDVTGLSEDSIMN
jgi:hypothetical protein